MDTSWILANGLFFDDGINKNYQKLGIVIFRCPPHAAFLEAVAEIPQIKALSFPESPITIYKPIIGKPMMIDVRKMVGVNEQIQEEYGYGIRVAIVDFWD